jgi:hypothetical protein
MIGSHRTSRAPYGGESGGKRSMTLPSSTHSGDTESRRRRAWVAGAISSIPYSRSGDTERRDGRERSISQSDRVVILSIDGFSTRIAWSSDTGKKLDTSSVVFHHRKRSNDMIPSPFFIGEIIWEIYPFASEWVALILHFVKKIYTKKKS